MQHDAFGYSLDADGDLIVAGSPWRTQTLPRDEDLLPMEEPVRYRDLGAAYVMRWENGTWLLSDALAPEEPTEDERFGRAVAVNALQPLVAVGATTFDSDEPDGAQDTGMVYIFRPMAGQWHQTARLSDHFLGEAAHFGASLSIDGVRIAVGAPDEFSTRSPSAETASGVAYIFEFQGTMGGQEVWSRKAWVRSVEFPPETGDNFGADVVLAGGNLIVGAPGRVLPNASRDNPDGVPQGAGSVHIFEQAGNDAAGDEVWREIQTLTASAYHQSEEPVGSPNEGSEREPVVEDGAMFGSSVSLDRAYLVVGAPGEDVGEHENAGAAHVFRKTDMGWVYAQRLTARHPHHFANFGYDVEIGDGRLLVGSPGDPGDATSVPGAPNSNAERRMPIAVNRLGAGAVHVFELRGGTWTESGFVKTREAAIDDGLGFSVALRSHDGFASGAFYEGDVPVGGGCDDNDYHSGAVFIFDVVDEQ